MGLLDAPDQKEIHNWSFDDANHYVRFSGQQGFIGRNPILLARTRSVQSVYRPVECAEMETLIS